MRHDDVFHDIAGVIVRLARADVYVPDKRAFGGCNENSAGLSNDNHQEKKHAVWDDNFLRLACDAFSLSFAEAIEETKKLLNMGDFQGFMNAVAYTHQRHSIFVSLVSDIGPY